MTTESKPFRLQCKTGRVLLDSLSTTSSFDELQVLITKKTGIRPNRQKILFGYPPKEVCSYDRTSSIGTLGIKKGEMLFLQELEIPRSADATSPLEERLALGDSSSDSTNCAIIDSSTYGSAHKLNGTITRRVVPADNSCLFRSISILLASESSCADLRELVAGVITSQPGVYSSAILGREPLDYVSWILQEDSWGGAIELAIFSKLFSIELDVVDIQTERVEKFGQDAFYTGRALLIYDGIHYDPLVLCDHRGNVVQTTFPISNTAVLKAGLVMATEANKARQFTDVANFSLRCLVCNELLKGHADAESHAKSTGHINFGEV